VIIFLFIMLLKVPRVAGSQATLMETIIPSLIQTEQENVQLSTDNEKIKQELAKYAQNQSASALANQQLQEAKINAGLIGVAGPGIRITLDDSLRVAIKQEDRKLLVIHEQYIREIFNALWNGGAEAIAVNGQRVTMNTEVFCSGSYIQINGTRQMPPYIIEAIGDTKTLSAALKFYDWFKLGDLQQQKGITRKLEALSKVVIPAGKLRDYHYAQPIKEGTKMPREKGWVARSQEGERIIGLFSFLKDSINKSREIREISARLSRRRSSKELVTDMLTRGPSERDLAKERLLALCKSNNSSSEIMEKYNVTRENLNVIFRIKKLFERIRRILHG